MDVYKENGYENRTDYLRSMAEEFDVSTEMVFALAAMLGESEDFDGLVSMLEDAEGGF